jgi:hypothetical protein
VVGDGNSVIYRYDSCQLERDRRVYTGLAICLLCGLGQYCTDGQVDEIAGQLAALTLRVH